MVSPVSGRAPLARYSTISLRRLARQLEREASDLGPEAFALHAQAQAIRAHLRERAHDFRRAVARAQDTAHVWEAIRTGGAAHAAL